MTTCAYCHAGLTGREHFTAKIPIAWKWVIDKTRQRMKMVGVDDDRPAYKQVITAYETHAFCPGSSCVTRYCWDEFRWRMGIGQAQEIVKEDSPYGILGLDTKATWAEVRKAYKALVFIHHPDLGGVHEDFIRIQAAYEILEELLAGLEEDDASPSAKPATHKTAAKDKPSSPSAKQGLLGSAKL